MNPYADAIDQLLACDKVIAGTPSWRVASRDEHFDWSAMLETAEGAPTGLKWIIDAEPGWSDQPFSIHLVYMSHPIWRAEIKKRCSHVNKPPVPTGCDVGLIEGPHHHPWQLNRHLCKLDGPPQQLKFAAPLPPQVVKFENAIRWFAAAARIAIDFELPHYPTKGLL